MAFASSRSFFVAELGDAGEVKSAAEESRSTMRPKHQYYNKLDLKDRQEKEVAVADEKVMGRDGCALARTRTRRDRRMQFGVGVKRWSIYRASNNGAHTNDG
jgi:hypothetical protein